MTNSGAGLMIPAESTFLVGAKHYAFIEQQTGQFTRVEVGVGKEVNGWVIVTSGIHAGQRVVSSGALLLEQLLETGKKRLACRPTIVIKRLVTFALTQPLFTFGPGAIVFIGAGLAAFINLPIEAFPDIADIQVQVITLYPGYAAEEVENRSPLR